MSGKLHSDEVPIDAELVARLVGHRFPEWAHLPITRVESGGTVNAIYRLGAEMSVRLPLAEWGTEALEREFHWLPRLAPQLPLEIPIPLARGEPSDGYPFPWSVHQWIDGDIALPHHLGDARQSAIEVAGFIRALQAMTQRTRRTTPTAGFRWQRRIDPLGPPSTLATAWSTPQL
ncbi:MAG: phosphotransferase [Actinomycetota bacterium]